MLNHWIEHIWPQSWVQKLFWAVVAIFVLLVIRWLVLRSITRYVHGNDSRYRSRKATNFAWVGVLVIVLAFIFSEDLGGIGVTLGVAGAGIAFALQEVIVSFAGWLALLGGNFYRTGDRVQLGGIKGDVIDIGVLRTTVMEMGDWVNGDLYNGRIVRIANSFVFKEPVFNYSSDFPFLWDEITIPITYDSDLQAAEAVIQTVAEKHLAGYAAEAEKSWKTVVQKFLIEDASVQPMVSMVGNDNWVEFTLRYVTEFKRRRKTKSDLFRDLIQSVKDSGQKVRFASATFDIVGLPEVAISLNRSNADPKPKS